jgi:hypothetical protein
MSKLGSKQPNLNSNTHDSLVIKTMTRLFLVKGEGVPILFLVRVNAEALQLRSIIKAVGLFVAIFCRTLSGAEVRQKDFHCNP